MNIYHSWRVPYHRLILENIFYFTSAYRPMGSLVYRVLFDLAGMNPLPFRVLCFVLIFGNLYLAYRTAAALSTNEAGMVTALLLSYNAGFIDLYYNTGTIYDLLCFTFYFLALQLYVSIRQRGHLLKPGVLTAFLILYVCALNSKEMAVTLPVILCCYELTAGRFKHECTATYLRSRWAPAVLSALLTVPFVVAKFSSSSPLMGNADYRLHPGVGTYLEAIRHYVEPFILPPDNLTLAALVVALILFGMVAIIARRPVLLFAWLFVVITPLPVAFISLRGGYAVYVSTFGIALLIALVIIEFRDMLIRGVMVALRYLKIRRNGLLQASTFALCLLLLFAFHSSRPLGGVNLEDELLRSITLQFSSVQPKIDSTSRILFLDDPLAENYALLFMLRLYYRQPDLSVDRVKMMPRVPSPSDLNSYDFIFTVNEGRSIRVKP